MARFALFLIVVVAGCARQPQVYDPHAGSDYPPLRIEVGEASLAGGDLRVVGVVRDAEHGWPVAASVGLGRWGERVVADSAGSFTLARRAVSEQDTVVVYRPGWSVLMERVGSLVGRP